MIPDEDPQRPVETNGDEADADAWDAAGDGFRCGDNEENSDSEEEDEDDSDALDESANAAQKLQGTRRPLPSWINEPFKRLLKESENRDHNHLPPLYSIHKTFYFPSPSTFFLLDVPSLQPHCLYQPQFFLWDPEALCAQGIPCPSCKAPLDRHMAIPRPRRVVTMDSHIWFIGYRYRCRTCINPATGKTGTMTFRSWDPRILAVLPPHLADEFPAKLSHRSGISKPLFHFMRTCFQNGMGHKQFPDALRVQHHLHYDYIHLQYLDYLADGMEIDAWRGRKWMSFLPFDDTSLDGPNNFVPSAQWLRDMYDAYIERHKHDFNQHTALLSGDICAIDHSHKVKLYCIFFPSNCL